MDSNVILHIDGSFSINAILHLIDDWSTMPMWRIDVYLTDEKTDPFRDWLSRQDTAVRAEFVATLVTLLGTPDWDDPEVKEFKVLEGRDVGLAEVRFRVIQQLGKKQLKRNIRALGVFLPSDFLLVLLTGFEKSGRDNRESYELAHRLSKQYFQKRGKRDAYFK